MGLSQGRSPTLGFWGMAKARARVWGEEGLEEAFPRFGRDISPGNPPLNLPHPHFLGNAPPNLPHPKLGPGFGPQIRMGTGHKVTDCCAGVA